MNHRNCGVPWIAVGLCLFVAPPGWIRHARAEVPCLIDVLEGTDPNHFTQPGSAVDIDGDFIIAGSPSEGISAAGAVYLYRRDGLRWKLDGKFVETPLESLAQLGSAVAISGDWAIAGAADLSTVEFDAGRAHVYRHIGGQWQYGALLTASVRFDRDGFGYSVDIEGDVAVVGAIYAMENPSPGKAFVFRWNGSAWVEEAILSAPGATTQDLFGISVSISGNRIAVGAIWDDMGDGVPGSAYVFKYEGGAWVSEARIRPDDDQTSKEFGTSVALRDGLLVVGAPEDRTFSNSNGAVYVFTWNGASWVQEVKLFPPNPVGDIGFGLGVDLTSNVIAALSAAPPLHPNTAHIFVREGSDWTRRYGFTNTGYPAVSEDGALLVAGNHVYGLGAFPPCVPVTSVWGVLIMALTLGTLGSILLRRHMKRGCVCVCVWLHSACSVSTTLSSLKSPVSIALTIPSD